MGKGKSTSTSTSEPWRPMQGHLIQGASDLTNLFNSGGMTTDYSGDWVADMTPGQLAALGGVTGTANQNNGVLGGIVGSLTGLADGSTQANTWDTIANDTIQRIMPSINSSFAGSGMTGSTLHQQNLSKGMGEGLASAYSDYANNAVNQQLAATSSLGGVLGQMLGNNQAAYNAERALQTQEQNELDSQYQNSLLGQNADFEALSNYLSVISGIAGLGGQGGSTQTQKPGLGGILGGIASIGSLFSDRRLKTDVKRVGQTDSGLGVYTYRYRGSDTVHMGVMADEVVEIMPEAVADMGGGFMAVNYGAL